MIFLAHIEDLQNIATLHGHREPYRIGGPIVRQTRARPRVPQVAALAQLFFMRRAVFVTGCHALTAPSFAQGQPRRKRPQRARNFLGRQEKRTGHLNLHSARHCTEKPFVQNLDGDGAVLRVLCGLHFRSESGRQHLPTLLSLCASRPERTLNALMLFKTLSAAVYGIDASIIEVEVDISGIKCDQDHFHTVGLPDAAVRESRDRVRAALKNCGYDIPLTHITINLAPADIKKEGSGFDLPMALGILGAYGGLNKKEVSDCLFVGELSLDGGLRGVRGALPIAVEARSRKIAKLVVPEIN